MAGVAVSMQVGYKSSMGRFISQCEAASLETIEEAVTDGSRLASDLAPHRTGKLAANIVPVVLSRTSGRWVAQTKYAMAQEEGAVDHFIVGNPRLGFFWDREGRYWIPAEDLYGMPGLPDIVDHPGNPGTHYLRDSYRVVSKRLIAIAARAYPG